MAALLGGFHFAFMEGKTLYIREYYTYEYIRRICMLS